MVSFTAFSQELEKIAEEGYIPISTPAIPSTCTPFGDEKPDKTRRRRAEGRVKTATEGSIETSFAQPTPHPWEDDADRKNRVLKGGTPSSAAVTGGSYGRSERFLNHSHKKSRT